MLPWKETVTAPKVDQLVNRTIGGVDCPDYTGRPTIWNRGLLTIDGSIIEPDEMEVSVVV